MGRSLDRAATRKRIRFDLRESNKRGPLTSVYWLRVSSTAWLKGKYRKTEDLKAIIERFNAKLKDLEPEARALYYAVQRRGDPAWPGDDEDPRLEHWSSEEGSDGDADAED
jgi:hypothetical protein